MGCNLKYGEEWRRAGGMQLNDKQTLLSELHQARLDRLKEICAEHGISRNGSVEALRGKLIADLVLDEWDFSPEGIDSILNNDLGDVLAVFGVKKSGSIRERRQRLYLHLNHDAKQLTPEKLDKLSRDQLHELCSKLDLPRSGAKQALLMRVAGVLTSQSGSWGMIKKSLRRPRGKPKTIPIPSPSDEYDNISSVPITAEVQVIEPMVNTVPEEIEVVQNVAESNEVEVIDISPKVIQEVAPVTPVVELTASVIEIESRTAEIDALCRDYLMVGSITDSADVDAFISSLSRHGMPTNDQNAADFVKARLYSLDVTSKAEKDAMHSMPNSWREREALRHFEEARDLLREALPELIKSNEGNMIKARMAFEDKARELYLDLRIPSVSGRVHALFDLQISLDDEIAASDPRTARRTRVIRILQHGAIHLQPGERRTLDRLERNIEGFEQLVEAILEKAGGYGDSQQTLVIRFLEKKGYDVNNSELRPRVIAAAGVVGAELGHISPSEIPRIAPGIKVSDTEVESIISDLRRLAQQFKSEDGEIEADEDLELAESVADAADRVNSLRTKIDGVDDLLARLNLSNN